MFEENNNNEFDLMMKSVLDEGQEEVPAHVWDAVSEGLDKADRRKSVVLWWRRTAVGVAAAAAVVAAVFFNMDHDGSFVPVAEDSSMIAVVEPAQPVMGHQEEIQADSPARHMVPTTAAEAIALSEEPAAEISEQIVAGTEGIAETESIVETDIASERTAPRQERTEEAKEAKEAKEYFHADWGEEDEREKMKASLVLSGIANTNSTQGNNRIGPMKAPTITSAPQKTGITETSTKSTYGLPVSLGAGIKMELSPRWSIGIGANYTLLTRQFYGKYTKVAGDGSIERSTSSDIRNTQQFIGIPVNVYYNIAGTDRISFYAYAGGTAEKCISDKYNVLNTSINHTEKVKGIQMSANAGIGVEMMLGKHLGLYIDPSLRYYFDNGQPKSIRTVQPLMFGFEFGFRARL